MLTRATLQPLFLGAVMALTLSACGGGSSSSPVGSGPTPSPSPTTAPSPSPSPSPTPEPEPELTVQRALQDLSDACTDAVGAAPFANSACVAIGLEELCANEPGASLPICSDGALLVGGSPDEVLALAEPLTGQLATLCAVSDPTALPTELSTCFAGALDAFCAVDVTNALPFCAGGIPGASPDALFAVLGPVAGQLGDFCLAGGLDGGTSGLSQCLASSLSLFCEAPGAGSLPFCDAAVPTELDPLLSLLGPVTDVLGGFCGDALSPAGLSGCLATSLSAFCTAPGAEALPLCSMGDVAAPTDPTQLLALLAPVTDLIGTSCVEALPGAGADALGSCLSGGLTQFCAAPFALSLPVCDGTVLQSGTAPEQLLQPVLTTLLGFCDLSGSTGTSADAGACLAGGLTSICGVTGSDQFGFCEVSILDGLLGDLLDPVEELLCEVPLLGILLPCTN